MFTFPYKATVYPAYRDIQIFYSNQYGDSHLLFVIPLGIKIEWTDNYYLETEPSIPF